VTKDRTDRSLPAAGDAPAGKAEPASPPRAMLPRTTIGRRALGLSAVAAASWVVLPIITIVFRHTYPITDTWVMPAIGTLLTDAAAILNVLATWRRGERSALSVVLAVLMVPIALFFTFMVVGEGLGGV
jgi:hypothetical protein